MADGGVVEQFVAFAGVPRFNEFISALAGPAAQRRRLLYWQESLWREFAEVTPGVSQEASYEHLAALFQGQQPRERALSREEFLADPSGSWLDPNVKLEPGWVAEAWHQELFRKNMTYLLVRSVSKTGSLQLALDAATTLAAELNSEQVSALYSAIIDESRRSADEWRSEFERIFGGKTERLPR